MFNTCQRLAHAVLVKTYLNDIFIAWLKFSEDGFYPDKDDCRKFHVCYSGTQSIRWCKEGMIWDETKIGCSVQNNTSCTGGRKKWGRNDGRMMINDECIENQKRFRIPTPCAKICQRELYLSTRCKWIICWSKFVFNLSLVCLGCTTFHT